MMRATRTELTRRCLWAVAMVVAFGVGAASATAQVADSAPGAGTVGVDVSGSGTKLGDQGEVLDRVVAVVNGEVVLDSDVEEERRFEIFQPLRDASAEFSRTKAIERLINRALILQQMKLQNQAPIPEAKVDEQLAQVRKDIPECKVFHCETDAGWKAFVAAQGFTLPELQERWRARMEVLRFIEQRFRMGILISPDEIKAYYDKTLLPEYQKRHVTPPKLETISDRIQEVLLQQQVSSLLRDWLTSLKAQGSVRILGVNREADR